MLKLIACLLLSVSASALATEKLKHDPVIATVGEKNIRLSEVDLKGGKRTIELAQELFKVRGQYLYLLLSDAVLVKEAAIRGITVDQLIDNEISSKLPPVTPEDIKMYIANNPKVKEVKKYQSKVGVYLKVQRGKKTKRDYINTLLKKHKVQLAMYRPPEMPAIEVTGNSENIAGEKGAPVEIVLFSDFECPYCKRLHTPLEQLAAAYPKEIVITHKHFPIPGHGMGERAAVESFCAGQQGKFKAYYDAIFTSDGRLDSSRLDFIPIQIGLDKAKLATCLADPASQMAVDNDKNEGKRIGIQATPTMVINGKMYPGAASFDKLKEIVDALI